MIDEALSDFAVNPYDRGMPKRMSFGHARSVLSVELAAIRNRGPELDAGEVASVTLPLLLGLLGCSLSVLCR